MWPACLDKTAETMTEELENYIAAHIEAEPLHLRRIYRRTHLNHLYPRMCSGHLQGRILAMISQMVAPRAILELGAFTGYSTLCLAEGLQPGGRLTTVEIDDELEEELLEVFADAGKGDAIDLRIGDALEIVPQLDGPWDLVFIDANKRNYCDYFRLVVDKVRPGGFILADNTLWSEKIAATPPPSDAQSVGIMDFNDLVASDPRVSTVILPLRDGLTLMRRL